MTNKKKLFNIAILSLLTAGTAVAQTGVNSPYSRYGFGTMADQGSGFNKGMASVGYALGNGQQINPLNPASYANIDSLTCLFDMGISLDNGNYNDGSKKMNVKSSSFDYISMAFRLKKNIGMALGFRPYSNIGYTLNQEKKTGAVDFDHTEINSIHDYYGEGGLHQLYAGVGWRPFKPLSVGANAAYVFGDYTHNVVGDFSLSTANSTSRSYSADIKAFRLELGAQFTQPVGKKGQLALGVTYGLKSSVNNPAYMFYGSSNTEESINSDTTKVSNAFEFPQTLGIGIAYTHNKRLTLAFDYTLHKWGAAKFPAFDGQSYSSQKGTLGDYQRYAIGLDWLPTGVGGFSQHYLSHVHYRAGAYYSSPYTLIDGKRAYDEYGVTFGFGLPILNFINNRSLINISAGWVHREPKSSGMIKENYLRVSLGITFNEAWFMKWKFK